MTSTYLKSLCLVFITSCLLAATAFNAHAQTISGLVTGTNERLSGAIIKNLASNDEAISNVLGMFTIKVEAGDTLLISKDYYVTDTLVYRRQPELVVQLRQAVHVLKQVDIKDSVLSPLATYEKNKQDYKDIFWKGDDSKIVTIPTEIDLGMEIGININIDKLYSALSKQGKDARRMQHTLLDDYHNSVVDQKFSKTLVSRVTGYKGEKLDDFIVKYRPSYEFASKATNYDMVQYIRKKQALDLKG
jgi:hypothetical protein